MWWRTKFTASYAPYLEKKIIREKAWIEGMDDWSKMKGNRFKNKPGKLETHFSCDGHIAALHDYTNFVWDGGHFDMLSTKQQRTSKE